MQLLEWRGMAEHDAVDSRHPMHDDALARKLGFAGGLVPGVTVYGYLTHPLVAALGVPFLEHGFMTARFRRPVYAGQTVSARTTVTASDATRVTLDLSVSNPAGVTATIMRISTSCCAQTDR